MKEGVNKEQAPSAKLFAVKGQTSTWAVHYKANGIAEFIKLSTG